MRAKKIFENYPPGAEYDSRAPWNEKNTQEETTLEIESGDYNLITRVMDEDGDWEEIERLIIDPYDMDQLICQKLGINFKNLLEQGDTIEIEEVINQGNVIILYPKDLDDVKITLEELNKLVKINQKRLTKSIR